MATWSKKYEENILTYAEAREILVNMGIIEDD